MEVCIELQSKDYFGNLNVLAQKIATDIERTQEAYQNLWYSLSKEEQNQVIDESIISPAAVLKYAHLEVPITKESPYKYSWFTKSQLDLLNHDNLNQELLPSTNREHQVCSFSLANPVEEMKDNQSENIVVDGNKVNQEGKCSAILKSQVAVTYKISVLKPKTPPPPPPLKIPLSTCDEKLNDESEGEIVTNYIPKTGFDFLDNW